jgi:hypothetical protein
MRSRNEELDDNFENRKLDPERKWRTCGFRFFWSEIERDEKRGWDTVGEGMDLMDQNN